MPSPAAVPLAPLMRNLNIEGPPSQPCHPLQPTQKPNGPHPSADSLKDTIFHVSGTVLAVQSSFFRTLQRTPVIFSRGVLFFEPFPTPTTFPILASVLRMSHKYDAEALRKRALVHLSQAYPTTLEAWDALPELPWSSGLSLDIVSIARRVDPAHEFLPNLPELVRPSCAVWRPPRCARAGLSVGVLWQVRHQHPMHGSTANMRREVETKRKYDAEDPASMCLGCVSDVKMLHDEAREELWEDLPRIFGLGDWQKLEAMKAEALK
ncbi:hypothetical protein B0H14DRAFT_3733280 [Mycena olivaceomarginata]|nr:hypothetical protein B0H14DRAFT_3733280 [Mycena olivaceomarginata]